MAFKSMVEYNDQLYGNMFRLQNDGNHADVIFLYQERNDAMMVDAHYIKSSDYSGYVQCLGSKICPACKRGIRVQNKLFIPMYVIHDDGTGEVVFWDRSTRFFQQLDNYVFSKFPNPSEFVFRITRRGAAGDINTKYEIVAIGKNNVASYNDIVSKLTPSFPEYYNTVCADWSVSDYESNLAPEGSSSSYSSDSDSFDAMPEYRISPRKVVEPSAVPDFSSEDAAESDSDIDNVSF